MGARSQSHWGKSDDDGAHKRKDADGAKEEVLLSLQEQAAATISDLAYGDEDMQDAIIEADGVPPLLNLLQSQLAQENAARQSGICVPLPTIKA